VNGILCIDKPAGVTSFRVVAQIRRITGIRRVGHGGTLDPMATGVLPVFLGRATKLCDILPNQDKGYRASLRLGLTTDTQDITGRVLGTAPVKAGLEEVRRLLLAFLGDQEQIPPMHSAVKIHGEKLYNLARQGIAVERPPRKIHIYSIVLEGGDEERGEYDISVGCSKGTYIRTICHDLGQALGCGAVLTGLRRTAACGFSLADCITLEQAEEQMRTGELENRILPCEAVFRAVPRLELTQRQAFLFCNGVRLTLEDLPLRGDEGQVAVYCGERFLGTGVPDSAIQRLRLQKLFELEAST